MTNNNIYWLNEDSRTFLSRGYLTKGQTAEERIRQIAEAAEKYLGIEGFADKFERYMHLGFYSLSSPIWSNLGLDRGLPISCFGSFIPDTMEGIEAKQAEVGIMTKNGGGTSAYFGALRERGAAINSGGTSTGSCNFMELYEGKTGYVPTELEFVEKMMGIISQGNVRRGSFAAYLPIDHPDIVEFLKIRDEHNPIQNMSFGVTVSDKWLEEMKGGDKAKQEIWLSVIKKRFETGYPYIFFSDNVNNNAPQVYKDKGLTIWASNLCTEIFLSSTEKESFVCDLSSLNLAKWDEIVKTDAIKVLVYFLDAVMSEFIQKTEGKQFMEAPREFAINQRAIGVGALGWHSLLQDKMISFESMEAKGLNIEIWKKIRKDCDEATAELAVLFGEPPLLKGYGRRNTTTIAIAPTTSSSFILGQISPSVEPLNSNYFVKDLAKGTFSYKNPVLISFLETKGRNDHATWRSILEHGGSVQHLDFLSSEEKAVFKTFGEISQKEIIIQAAGRQKYIDQGQSINLMIPPGTKPKDVNTLMLLAHELGLKSLYYQRSANPAQELARNILHCESCE